jgi:hypothetical protein
MSFHSKEAAKRVIDYLESLEEMRGSLVKYPVHSYTVLSHFQITNDVATSP